MPSNDGSKKVRVCSKSHALPEGRTIARDARTNRRIRAREVRLIGANGEQLGVMPTEKALEIAQENGLDLVEVSPMSKPPVCKVMDYGKFKYEEKKHANEAKKKQTIVKVKEVQMGCMTDGRDFEIKVNKVRSILEEGDKVRITVKFKGREMSRRELGQKKLTALADILKDDAVIEQSARTEGRMMFMVMAASPKLKAAAAAAAKERQKIEEDAKAAKAARQAAKSSAANASTLTVRDRDVPPEKK